MKKLMTVLSLVLAVSAITPTHKANAGVILAVNSIVDLSNRNAGTGTIGLVGAGALIAGGIIITNQIYANGANYAGVLGQIVGISLMVLDTNAELPQSALEEHLSKSFPFIDNHESIKELATTIKTRSEDALHAKAKTAMISLTESETRAALAISDLTEAQIASVVTALK